jgi:hypothetical protein
MIFRDTMASFCHNLAACDANFQKTALFLHARLIFYAKIATFATIPSRNNLQQIFCFRSSKVHFSLKKDFPKSFFYVKKTLQGSFL